MGRRWITDFKHFFGGRGGGGCVGTKNCVNSFRRCFFIAQNAYVQFAAIVHNHNEKIRHARGLNSGCGTQPHRTIGTNQLLSKHKKIV